MSPVTPVRPPERVTPVTPPRPAPHPAPQPNPAPSPPPRAEAAPAVQLGAEADDVPPWLDLPPEELDDAPQALIEAPQLPEEPAAAAPSAPGLEPTPLGEAWAALFGELSVAALARTLGMQGQCLRLERGASAWQVTLRVSGEALRMAPGPAKLEAALTEHAGVPVKLDTEVGPVTDSPALREAAAKAARQLAAEAAVANSAELAALKRHFETTRIVPGTVRPLSEN
ncbi:hypothetical protein I7X39_06915 [Inhella sp. 1Y17]|uniref:DNA polymerase III tau subunit domain-containing protein n=1 Tax=Inhella proteolytica TaxID=2795029 RepID=A0A931J314_9BURK|nr:hypothetical protein [Inhella proteolytica]